MQFTTLFPLIYENDSLHLRDGSETLAKGPIGLKLFAPYGSRTVSSLYVHPVDHCIVVCLKPKGGKK